MFLNLAKVSEQTLSKIVESPAMLEALFFEEGANLPPDYNAEADEFGMDYRSLSALAEAMAKEVELEEQDTWIAKALGNAFGKELDYEFCYGGGFYLTPLEVKQVAAGLKEEGWHSDGDDFGDEDIEKFFATAASENKGILGGVS